MYSCYGVAFQQALRSGTGWFCNEYEIHANGESGVLRTTRSAARGGEVIALWCICRLWMRKNIFKKYLAKIAFECYNTHIHVYRAVRKPRLWLDCMCQRRIIGMLLSLRWKVQNKTASESGKMTRIAIVEDTEEDAAMLSEYCRRYAKENDKEFNIERYSNGFDFMAADKLDYDIIMLDIKMPYMNGLQTAKKIRECNDNVCIIFITNMQ